MHNKQPFAWLILLTSCFFFSCRGISKDDSKKYSPAVPVTRGERYLVDTIESLVTWTGTMTFSPGEGHTGYVHLLTGTMMVENGQLLGGKVMIDMNSIEYADKNDRNTPVMHLKSPDYFDVGKYPISTMIISEVSSVSGKTVKISGDLTIKGVTRPVSFPGEVEISQGVVDASGTLKIDRTDWGIRYRSGKFYDGLADQAVSDEIAFRMKIVARK